MSDEATDKIIPGLTSRIVAAYAEGNSMAASELPALIKDVARSLRSVVEVPAAPQQPPAVSPRQSLKPDYIVCLECGRRQRTLKRHLRTAHELTQEEYRRKWGLKADYPMVAPNYARQRSEMARQIGLGHLRRSQGKGRAKGGRTRGAKTPKGKRA